MPPSLPKPVHERLKSEFRIAASKVAEARDIPGKIYYFSVFYGESSRQLNIHWDADLALLWLVVQATCHGVNNRLTQATNAEYPLGGFPHGFGAALDQVSEEFATAFEGGDVDIPRLYAALARTAELTYITSGNGAYLYDKGIIKL